MIDIFSYKIMYFIIALTLGFLLGYILKRSSYEKKIEKEVLNKEKLFDSSSNNLLDINKQLIETENRYKINNELISSQDSLIKKIDSDIVTTKQKIVNLEEAKKELSVKFDDSSQEIIKYKNKITEIKPQYENAEYVNNKSEELLKNKDKASFALVDSKDKMEIILKEIEEEDIKYLNMQKDLIKKDEQLKKLDLKLNALEDKKPLIKDKDVDLNSISEELKVKNLNYKYEIENIKRKLENGEKISNKYIDDFISKNEHQRFIDKFITKIFNKKATK